MTLQDFSNAIKGIISDLEATRTTESVQIANEGIALVRRRVQNDKENADGSYFGSYSETKVPKWFFKGKSLSGGAETKVQNGAYFISYAEFRDANNLESQEIDFTFSGDMWRNTGVTEVVENESETEVMLGGQTSRAKELHGYHAEKFGSLIVMNEDEIKMIVDSHNERIFNVIRKNLG